MGCSQSKQNQYDIVSMKALDIATASEPLSSSSSSSRKGVPISIQTPKLYKGVKESLKILCRDEFHSKFTGELMYRWRPAEIVEFKNADRSHVLVHFDGWASTFDIWLDLNEGQWNRLALSYLMQRSQRETGTALSQEQAKTVIEFLYTGRHAGQEKGGETEFDDHVLRSFASQSTDVGDTQQYSVSQLIDVLDIFYKKGSHEAVYKWRKASIIDKTETKIRIQYIGWDSKYDETLDITKDANRISAYGDHTGKSPSQYTTRLQFKASDSGKRDLRDAELEPEFIDSSPLTLSDKSKRRAEVLKDSVPTTPRSMLAKSGHFFSKSGKGEQLSFNKPYSSNKSQNFENRGDSKEEDEGDDYSVTASEVEREHQRDLGFIRRLKDHGMEVISIDGDGNCLFRAVSYQLYLNEDGHEILRKKCVEHLRAHRKRFEMFCDGDFDEHTTEMSKAGVWGDDLEIRALEEILDRIICIYSADTEDLNSPINSLFEEVHLLKDPTPIKLSYHGQNHYNSIVDRKNKLPLEINYSTNLLKSRLKLFESSTSSLKLVK